MILAAHVILSAYGFWLPSDPRGSWSDFVRAFDLLRFGDATKTDERNSLARSPHNSALRAAAKKELVYPPVILDGLQARAIANGFADVVRRTGCAIHACAIMPDHTHLVIGRHRYDIQKLVNLLKGGATTRLRKEGLDPFASLLAAGPKGRGLPSPWARKFWKVWLNTDDDVTRSITYTRENPTSAGLDPQQWKFVTPYVPA
jgi:REP element-mobilizing transposase RayT